MRSHDPRKLQAAPFFDEAMKLGEKGQNAESLEKFKKAYAIYPSPNTLGNIARQEQLLGRRLQALRDYREALRNTLIHPGAAEQARANVLDLERVLSKVRVVGPDGTRVDIAGAEYTLPLGEPVDVEAGKITVRAATGSETLVGSADAFPGQTATITLKPAAAAGTATPPVVEPPPVEAEGPGVTRWVVPGAVLVAGAVGLGVGIGFSAKSQSTKTSFDDKQCGAVSSAECSSLRDSASSERTVAVVGYVAGGALIAGAAILWWMWPSRSTSARGSTWVVPQVGVGQAGAALGGNF